MAQHLADLLKRGAAFEHLDRGGVPQRVRSDRGHSRPLARRNHDRRDPLLLIPPAGAITRKNTARSSIRGRRRKYETIASPTSVDSGSR